MSALRTVLSAAILLRHRCWRRFCLGWQLRSNAAPVAEVVKVYN